MCRIEITEGYRPSRWNEQHNEHEQNIDEHEPA
jgi:hypothetical protein